MFRTSNPAFRNEAFQPAQTWGDLERDGRIDRAPEARGPQAPAARATAAPKSMTIQGTVNKTFFLLALCIVTSVFTWNGFVAGATWVMPAMFGGLIGGLILAMIGIFAPKTTPVTAPLYATAEGFFLGGISAFYASRFATEEGMLNTALIFNAILLTFGITGGLLTAYSMRLIRPNRTFYNITITATFGIVIYALIAMVTGFLGNDSLWSVYDPSNGGLLSIGFSLFVVALASANLILDFDIINNGVKARAPRYMEWFGAMGIMITLVWLYIEVLRLLAKLQSRD